MAVFIYAVDSVFDYDCIYIRSSPTHLGYYFADDVWLLFRIFRFYLFTFFFFFSWHAM